MRRRRHCFSLAHKHAVQHFPVTVKHLIRPRSGAHFAADQFHISHLHMTRSVCALFRKVYPLRSIFPLDFSCAPAIAFPATAAHAVTTHAIATPHAVTPERFAQLHFPNLTKRIIRRYSSNLRICSHRASRPISCTDREYSFERC